MYFMYQQYDYNYVTPLVNDYLVKGSLSKKVFNKFVGKKIVAVCSFL